MAKPPTVSVSAFWKASKSRYFLKWRDPVTRKTCTHQTAFDVRNKRNDRSAAKAAKQFEIELNAKWKDSSGAMTWEEFLAVYKTSRLPRTSKENATKWRNAVAIFDEVWPSHVYGVLTLEEITPRILLAAEERMRETLSPASVRSYAATLRAGLSWAAKMGLMPMLPNRPPDVGDEETLPAMRLSPVPLEGLERMERAAKALVGKRHARSIADYMRCLWLSGARLMEPLHMHAFRLDCHHPIVLDGERPIFGWTSAQKNRRDMIAPISLDFAAWIRPRCEGRDFLFCPRCETGEIRDVHPLSKLISEIGEKAGVIAEPGDSPKTATAKHFRSSFVTRWSRRGMPLDHIQAIVRHASRATTEKYYLAPPDPQMLAAFRESDWVDGERHSKTEKA